MKILSLFDGISCGRVALEELGIKVDLYDAYEIEKNAIKISKSNYPDINHKGDVFKALYVENSYDLLIGGSPCTFWSCAKGSNGRETSDSGLGWDLFSQYVRALRQVKPKYFLYENNYSMSDDIKNSITRELGVEPIMINSSDFSAQERKRYYWTNIEVNLNYEKSNLVFDDILYVHDYKIIDFEKYKDTVKWNKDKTLLKYDTSGKGWYSQQSRCRKTFIKMNTLPASGTDKNNIYLKDFKMRKIHPIEAERLQGLPDNYTSVLKSSSGRIKGCGNGWTVPVIKHILKELKKS